MFSLAGYALFLLLHRALGEDLTCTPAVGVTPAATPEVFALKPPALMGGVEALAGLHHHRTRKCFQQLTAPLEKGVTGKKGKKKEKRRREGKKEGKERYTTYTLL